MKPSILVVEDDPVARMALAQTIESAGYHVSEAPNGETAIAMLSKSPFQVVLSDLRMPDIDGIDVLRAAAALPDAPIVLLLTGYSTVETAVAALRLGAADYLVKPVEPTVLLTTIAQVLKRRGEAVRQASALRTLAQGISDLQRQLRAITDPDLQAPDQTLLDNPDMRPRSHTIGALVLGRFPSDARYQGSSLHLTPIEHALLHCLADAPNRIATYSEIVRSTHGYETDAVEAQVMLKSHVRNLRRKTSSGLIANVRHIGYQLTAGEDQAGQADDE
jgi:DNA-binding response OmpR family regulator